METRNCSVSLKVKDSSSEVKGVFRILSNIYDGAKIANDVLPRNF